MARHITAVRIQARIRRLRHQVARPSSAFRRRCHGRLAQGGPLDRGLRVFDRQRLICVVDWISAAIAWECIVPDIPIAPFQAAHVHESRSEGCSLKMQPEDALLASARQLGGGVPFIQPRDGRPADSGCRGARAPNEPDAIEGRPHFLCVWHIFVLTSASPRGQDMLSHALGPNCEGMSQGEGWSSLTGEPPSVA